MGDKGHNEEERPAEIPAWQLRLRSRQELDDPRGKRGEAVKEVLAMQLTGDFVDEIVCGELWKL